MKSCRALRQNRLRGGTNRIRAIIYGLLLDYRSAGQYALSTRTIGLRATGPWAPSSRWSVLYAAEFANQQDLGRNPNHVNTDYYLAELGPGWRGFGLRGGYALPAGRSATDAFSTPLANPFNGWTELFSNNPNLGASHGLEVIYLTATGKLQPLGGTTATVIWYDYDSDSNRVHYGSEWDGALAYKIRGSADRWEVGTRFGRYQADRLYTRAVRVSVYSQFTL